MEGVISALSNYETVPLLEFFISSLGFTTQKPILLNKLLQNIHKRVHTFDHFTIQVGAFFQCFFYLNFNFD